MKAALISTGILIALAWAETLYEWDFLSRRRTRGGWPQSDLQWRLPALLALTAAFVWGAWRFFSR